MSDSTHALLARFEAKPGKEAEVEELLHSALPLAEEEAGMATWFALRLDESTFGIFDTFPDEEGRRAHLEGEIATQLMPRADELFIDDPDIRKVDVLEAVHP
jgi:quinol monooxygenase YgiN